MTPCAAAVSTTVATSTSRCSAACRRASRRLYTGLEPESLATAAARACSSAATARLSRGVDLLRGLGRPNADWICSGVGACPRGGLPSPRERRPVVDHSGRFSRLGVRGERGVRGLCRGPPASSDDSSRCEKEENSSFSALSRRLCCAGPRARGADLARRASGRSSADTSSGGAARLRRLDAGERAGAASTPALPRCPALAASTATLGRCQRAESRCGASGAWRWRTWDPTATHRPFDRWPPPGIVGKLLARFDKL